MLIKKIPVFFLALNIFSVVAFAQPQAGQVNLLNVPGTTAHYETEYTFDTIMNPGAWLNQGHGMHVSWGSTDERYFRREVPLPAEENLNQEIVWKGERLNKVILIWSADSLSQVRVTLKNLVSGTGQSINKDHVHLDIVRYVLSNYPYGSKDASCGGSPYKELYLMPDRFEPLDNGTGRFDLPGKTARMVWLSIDIPQAASPGIYNSNILIQSGKYSTNLPFKVRVQNQMLPAPRNWSHRLDLWQNPVIIARYNNLKPWSPEHLALLKKHLRLYADAGGKYITTYAVHSPWSDNSYWNEETMIEWIKQPNGLWKFDYSIFDTYVKLAMNAGIDKAITIYTPVPGGYRFRYLDEQSGNYVYESWAPGSTVFRERWNVFLTDLKKHLETKGWFEKTYIGINENPLDETLAAIKMVKANSQRWKITYAGDWHKELENLLDDYCYLYGKEPGVEIVKERSAKGFTNTYYVCCNPPVPNNFVFSPPAEGRWMGWYTAAHQYNGFLRWAYDAWPADPLRDARHESWPAGDCYLVYPGGNSCIRFEKLREGIADYEKISILRKQAANSHSKINDRLIQQLDEHLSTFLSEKTFEQSKIIEEVNQGRKLVDELSDQLSKN